MDDDSFRMKQKRQIMLDVLRENDYFKITLATEKPKKYF